MEREIKLNYKPGKKDLMLLSACQQQHLKIGAMVRKRADGSMALMMDVRHSMELPLYLGHIIEKNELAFEHIRLARKYYGMLYDHGTIHFKEPVKVIEKPIMKVKKPDVPLPTATFKF